MPNSSPSSPPLWSWRRITILAFLFLFSFCLYHLGFKFNQLPDGADPLSTAKKFFSAAFAPAIQHQNTTLPSDATPFLTSIAKNLLTTIRYAFIAMSMAVPTGLFLGFLSSKTWWPQSKPTHFLYFIYIPIRFFITFIRSIHELIWVMLFLAFLGDSPLTACIALALPFAGTLAKVFSEIIDEQPPQPSNHIKLAGGNGIQAFIAARFPQALPDLLTYTLYRLECAIRSSAVLGFIGIETIGLSIHQSYENNFYNEVWTSLYALIFSIILFDYLGSTIRKRLHSAPLTHSQPDPNSINQLKQQAPRWKLLKFFWLALIISSIAAWTIGKPLNQYHSHITRWERTKTFFQDLIPTPIRDTGNWSELLPWIQNLWQTNGANALFETIIMATTALLLAAIFGYALVPWASRNIASSHPFGITSGKPNKALGLLWSIIGLSTRFLFLISRSIPEFILAFLLIGILGPHVRNHRKQRRTHCQSTNSSRCLTSSNLLNRRLPNSLQPSTPLHFLPLGNLYQRIHRLRNPFNHLPWLLHKKRICLSPLRFHALLHPIRNSHHLPKRPYINQSKIKIEKVLTPKNNIKNPRSATKPKRG